MINKILNLGPKGPDASLIYGMINGFSMKAHISEWIKEAIDARKFEDSYS